MNNKTDFNYRSVIVSNVEFAPYDPIEYEYNSDQLCRGQIIVNIKDRTITFRHISGTTPVFSAVLTAMSINKHWFRMTDIARSDYAMLNYILLKDQCGGYYMAHYGENGLPVIDHIIMGIDPLSVEEVTLTTVEYCLIAESAMIYMWTNRQRRHQRNMFKKYWEFKYIIDIPINS